MRRKLEHVPRSRVGIRVQLGLEFAPSWCVCIWTPWLIQNESVLEPPFCYVFFPQFQVVEVLWNCNSSLLVVWVEDLPPEDERQHENFLPQSRGTHQLPLGNTPLKFFPFIWLCSWLIVHQSIIHKWCGEVLPEWAIQYFSFMIKWLMRDMYHVAIGPTRLLSFECQACYIPSDFCLFIGCAASM